jgi:membrane dipeptidase
LSTGVSSATDKTLSSGEKTFTPLDATARDRALLSPTDTEREIRERGLAIHRRTCVADLHSHGLLGAGYLGLDLGRVRRPLKRWNPVRNLLDLVDLPRAQEGGLGVIVFTVYVLPAIVRDYRTLTDGMIATLKQLVEKNSDRVRFAATADEVLAARASGHIAAMFAVEGGHSLGGELASLERLRAQGCVYLTLTHFVNNALSGSATDLRKKGLTPFGRDAIREMNRLGILVDVTHSSLDAKLEAARISTAPVIYSHTGLRRFVDAERMTTDEEIRAIAATGGLVGLLLSPYFLKGRFRAGVADIVDNIEHVCSLVGPDHVAIGSDFDSGLPPPDGIRDVRDYPEITIEMVRRGIDEATIAKVWSGNFLRVLRAVGR